MSFEALDTALVRTQPRCQIMVERDDEYQECGELATHVDRLAIGNGCPEDPAYWLFACPACLVEVLVEVLRATARRDQERAYTEEHGHPPYYDPEEGRTRIKRWMARLKTATDADYPEPIKREWRRILKQEVGYMRAWLRRQTL